MDQLRIATSHHAKDGMRWVAVELYVNDVPMPRSVEAFEKAHDYKPAGGYDFISLDGLTPGRDRLLGATESWANPGETVLLVCESCREEGCWPLFAHVEFGEDTVRWSGFRQPHRDDWDYRDLVFTFGRDQYISEVNRAFGE